MFTFDLEGNITLIGAAAATLVLILMAVICLSNSKCWGNKLIQKCFKRGRPQDQNFLILNDCASKDYRNVLNLERPTWKGGIVVPDPSLKRDSCYSSMSDTSEGMLSPLQSLKKDSLTSQNDDISVNTTVEQKVYFGEVVLKFNYVPNDNGPTRKLLITIQEANHLQPYFHFKPVINAFVEVMAFPSKRSVGKKGQIRMFFLRSRTVRGTQSPRFDETFLAVENVKNSDVQSWHLTVTAFDDNKFGNPTQLGSTDFPLKVAVDRSGQEIIYKCCLNQPKWELGEILIGMSYLPTSERLVLNILKVSNSCGSNEASCGTHSIVHTHVLLLSPMGRALKRKCTTLNRGEDGNLFNGAIVFKVPCTHLPSLTCLLLLCASKQCEDKNGTCETDEEKGPGPTKEERKHCESNAEVHGGRRSKRCKVDCFGKAILGGAAGTPEGQKHWLAIMQNPRKTVLMWHRLM